jgi:DNA polymerase III epsilon subunit-like protein
MSSPYLATLDFEASSLDESGYPIEVAFVLGTAKGIAAEFSTLIKPRPGWDGKKAWSEASQHIHGLSRNDLDTGMDADKVCDLLDLVLGGLSVAVDGGTFDTFWLERLYEGRACKFELDHLEDVDARWFLGRKRAAAPAHRALPDARWLWMTMASLRI